MSAIEIIREHGLTVEQLNRAWENEAKTNWKVQSLIRSGVNWDDLTRPALLDLIKRQQIHHEYDDDDDQDPHVKCTFENPRHTCTCFIDPPCSNCENCPSWEDER